MRNLCFISGSPRGKESASVHLLNELNKYINNEEYAKYFIDVKQSINKNSLESDFKNIRKSDIIVFAFPLYVYCVPGLLGRFLEEYYAFIKNTEGINKNSRVYVIVNCGFPEAQINNEAIRVIKNFCSKLNLNWRFALSIGMGGMITAIKDIAFMKRVQSEIYKGLRCISEDIKENDENKANNIFADITIPKSLYLSMGSKGWFKMAKENGLKKENLYKKPYI